MSDATDQDRWDAILAEGPATFIERTLLATGGDESTLTEQDREDLVTAATMAVTLQLVRAGADFDDVERQFTERDHHFEFGLDADGLDVKVVWDDEGGE